MRMLDAFYAWVMPYAPACAEPTADTHIIAAARDFCQATRCWREKDCIDVSGDEDEILCVPPYASLMEIEAASIDCRPLHRVQFADARLSECGEPEQITQNQPTSIALASRGRSGGKLSVSMFLMPAQNAQVVPDFLHEQYGQIIAQGALSTLLAIPEQPFSNGSLATYNAGLFQRAKDARFNLNVRGQQRASVRTRPRFL